MNNKKGPWTITGTEVKYKNPWIEVREDAVIRPDGKPGIFGTVNMKAGVSVLPLDKDGNVHLTDEYHYAIERNTLEIVSGGIDAGESTLDAAKRELQEETGFSAEEWTDLGSLDPFTGVINSPNHMYLARGLTKGEASPEGTEDIRIVTVPFEQAVEWVMSGKITHGASVAGILKAARLLESEK